MNLGSDEMVSMNEMQNLVLGFAGKTDMPIKHIPGPEVRALMYFIPRAVAWSLTFESLYGSWSFPSRCTCHASSPCSRCHALTHSNMDTCYCCSFDRCTISTSSLDMCRLAAVGAPVFKRDLHFLSPAARLSLES